MGEDSGARLGVSWAQVTASALAAVSSAVLLSTLGVAGTLIGAAVGSVVATIATALYTRTLDVSREQVATRAAALRRVTRARDELDEAVAARSRGQQVSDTGIARAGRELDEAEEVLAAADAEAGPREDLDEQPGTHGVRAGGSLSQARSRAWAALSWRRLAVAAGAVFLVTMATITAFELTTGRAVSTYTGGSDRETGSTVPGLGREERRPAPSESATPDDPTDDATDDPDDPDDPASPSDPATEDPTESDDPSAEPTEVPSDDPTPSPSLTPSPSPSPDVPSSTPAG